MNNFTGILKSDIKYEVLLPEYYRREVRSIFIDPAGEKGYKSFTVFMIPNLDGAFAEKLSIIKNKMEELGYKDIIFENVTDYIKMTDDEIENHIKFGDLTLHANEWFEENFNKQFNFDDLFDKLDKTSPLGILANILLK